MLARHRDHIQIKRLLSKKVRDYTLSWDIIATRKPTWEDILTPEKAGWGSVLEEAISKDANPALALLAAYQPDVATTMHNTHPGRYPGAEDLKLLADGEGAWTAEDLTEELPLQTLQKWITWASHPADLDFKNEAFAGLGVTNRALREAIRIMRPHPWPLTPTWPDLSPLRAGQRTLWQQRGQTRPRAIILQTSEIRALWINDVTFTKTPAT